MASRQRALVTGATGTQGGGCVRHCLRQGHDVYAFARNPYSPAAKGLEQLGAKLVQGDFEDQESLNLAMRDVNAVFFVHPNLSDLEADVRRAANVVTAARLSPNVSIMVASTALKTGQHEKLSGWGPSHPMYNYWRLKDTVEMLVRGAGFKFWTILRPASFLQLFEPPVRDFYFPGLVIDHTLRVAFGPATEVAWLDGRDVGVAAAQVLSQPAMFSGREIDLAAEALTINDMAGKLQEALGSEIRVHYYSDDEAEGMVKKGLGLIIKSQQWSNEVRSHDATKAVEHFALISVIEFFKQNKILEA